MGQFFKLFLNFMLIGLLLFSLFAFTVGFQKENNVDNKFIDNEIINNTFSGLKTNLENVASKGQNQKTLFESENPTRGFGTILLFSIVSAGKVFNGMIVSVFNAIIKLPVAFLGMNPLMVSIISAILILSIITGLWVLYKLGG